MCIFLKTLNQHNRTHGYQNSNKNNWQACVFFGLDVSSEEPRFYPAVRHVFMVNWRRALSSLQALEASKGRYAFSSMMNFLT